MTRPRPSRLTLVHYLPSDLGMHVNHVPADRRERETLHQVSLLDLPLGLVLLSSPAPLLARSKHSAMLCARSISLARTLTKSKYPLSSSLGLGPVGANPSAGAFLPQRARAVTKAPDARSTTWIYTIVPGSSQMFPLSTFGISSPSWTGPRSLGTTALLPNCGIF